MFPSLKLTAPAMALLCVLSPAVSAEPHRPHSDAEILERLPAAAARSPELERLRARLDAEPQRLELKLELARRHIQIGRRLDDPRQYGYAQAALNPWWDRETAPADVLVLRATIRQSRHAFDAALDDLDAALAQDARHVQAWLTRATVLRVLGQLEQARSSCRPLFRLGRPLIGAVCAAGVDALSGNAAAARRQLDALLALQLSPQLRLWVLTELAELDARLGDAAAAERSFHKALALAPDDVYLKSAYADLLLDQAVPQRVIDLLRGDTRVDRLLLRHVIAERRLGRSDSGTERRVVELRRRFAAAHERGDAVLHAGEEARFRLWVLEQPRRALDLAQRNWAQQREPRDARILLAAALASRRPAPAEPVLDFLQLTGLEDVRLAALVSQLQIGQP